MKRLPLLAKQQAASSEQLRLGSVCAKKWLAISEAAFMNQKVRQSGKLSYRFHLKHRHFTGQRQSKKAGLPPGSVVHIGGNVADKTTISAINYSENEIQEKIVKNVQELDPI